MSPCSTIETHKTIGSHYASSPKHIQALQIQDACRSRKSILGHIPIFIFLSYLGHPLLQRPEDRVTLPLSFRSSPITQRRSWAPRWTFLCMLLASAHKKCLMQKVEHLGSLGLSPMIHPPFCSSCVALQYEPGTKVFHPAVPEVCYIKNQKISTQPRGVSVRVYEVSDDFCWKCLVDGCSLCLTKGLRQRHHHPDSIWSPSARCMVHAYRLQYADYETHAETRMGLTCQLNFKD